MQIALEPAVKRGGADEMALDYIPNVTDIHEILVDIVKYPLKLLRNLRLHSVVCSSAVQKRDQLQKQDRLFNVLALLLVYVTKRKEQKPDLFRRLTVKAKQIVAKRLAQSPCDRRILLRVYPKAEKLVPSAFFIYANVRHIFLCGYDGVSVRHGIYSVINEKRYLA